MAICATLALASPAGGGCAAGPVRSWLAQGLLGPSKGCRRGLKNCKHSSLIAFNLCKRPCVFCLSEACHAMTQICTLFLGNVSETLDKADPCESFLQLLVDKLIEF